MSLSTESRWLIKKRLRRLKRLPPKKQRARIIAGMAVEMIAVPMNASARLDFLKRWSAVKVPRDDETRDRRERYQQWGGKKQDRRGICWVCSVETLLVYHHIVQLQHGGNSAVANLTRICDRCHADVHPWLQQPQGSGT